MPPPPPPKGSSTTRGCLLAVAVLLGVGALCTCTGLGIAAYTVYSRPELRRVVGATGDMVAMAEEGMRDPGAQALVAAGCEQAIAFPIERVEAIMREIAPDEERAAPPPDAPDLLVTCALRGEGAPPCAELARIFANAHASAPKSFALTVQSRTDPQACANLYAPNGELLRPLGEDETYGLPK